MAARGPFVARLAVIGALGFARVRGLAPGAVFVHAVIILVALLGILFRVLPVIATDFPLNDGGMFSVMVSDLRAAGFMLPPFTTYNGGILPFVYPPLGFYLAGLVPELLPVDVLWLFRALPLVFTLLALPAFWFLARTLLDTRAGAVVAVCSFALLPAAFQWRIMGGGVTRAPGFLFALLALQQAALMYQRHERRRSVVVGALAGLCLLFHIESAWFLAFSLIVFMLAFGRQLQGLVDTVIAGLVAAAVTAPWWGRIALTHGIEPFLAAPGSGSLALMVLGPTPSLGAIRGIDVILGLVACVVLVVLPDKRAFFLGWLIAVFLFDTRAIHQLSTPAVCLGLGAAIGDAFLGRPRTPPGDVSRRNLLRGRFGPAMGQLTVLVLLLTFVAQEYLVALGTDLASLRPLPYEERMPMQWVADNTPPSSTFLVITGDFWALDPAGEWFPALTHRVNLLTPQGTEWLPGGVFTSKRAAHAAAQSCGGQDVECLLQWERAIGGSFSHVYVARRPGLCCDVLRRSLCTDPAFALLHDASGATIFRRRTNEVSSGVSSENRSTGNAQLEGTPC